MVKQIARLNVSISTLLSLRALRAEMNITTLSREMDMTYSHTKRTVDFLEGDGFIKTIVPKSNRRTKLIQLTDRGVKLMDALDDLYKLIAK